jgi:hypothetical protein
MGRATRAEIRALLRRLAEADPEKFRRFIEQLPTQELAVEKNPTERS